MYPQSMYPIEDAKDGYIYTIYITCVGKDITDDIISGITSD